MPVDAKDGRSDAEIIEAVLAGAQEDFALLVQRHQRRVQRILRHMCGNAYDAEEMTQEAFYRVYFALPSYNPKYRFGSWLVKIACNLGISHLRKQGRTVSLEAEEERDGGGDWGVSPDPDPSLRPEPATMRNEQRAEIWSAVASLPPDSRDIIVMRHVEEMSYKEICDVTGLTMGTVKSRLARARAKLSGQLAD